MKLMITMILTIGSPAVFAHNILDQHAHAVIGPEIGFLVMMFGIALASIPINYFTFNKEKK